MLWTLGAWASAGVLSHANTLSSTSVTTLAEGGVVLPETASSWPWVALTAILALLTVISLAARRRLPFGGQV
jgi:hypothetical protein